MGFSIACFMESKVSTAESSSGGKRCCVAVVSEHVVEEFVLHGGATEQVLYVCIVRGI